MGGIGGFGGGFMGADSGGSGWAHCPPAKQRTVHTCNCKVATQERQTTRGKEP